MDAMKKITRRDVIRRVVDSWENQYCHCKEGDWKLTVLDKLAELDLETVDRTVIDEIIGNDSWTKLSCNQCEKDVEELVHLGDEPDYDSITFYICKDCLQMALNVANKGE